MQLISITFALFWLLALVIYYLCPKFQWQILLVASLLFYTLYSGRPPLVLAVCAVAAWGFGYISEERKRKPFIKLIIALHVLLFLFYKFLGRIGDAEISIMIPVGVSFFLLTSMGYCMDIHWERYEPEKNYAKLLLFLSFFPSIIQGPINRYDKLGDEIFKKHQFSMEAVCRGAQRFLWGFFKKLILVDRLNQITGDIFAGQGQYSGFMLSVGVFCFAVELYADFSGYMDMVIGIGQSFGIALPENFRQPFFSKTIAEFWRRWHITLGTWFKDYVMYGFIMSPIGRKIGKSIKKKSKRWGKLVPALIGNMIVWGLTGLWHGTSCGYLLWGVYYGLLMCITLCLEDFWKKRKAGHAFFESALYKLLCIVRTCLFVFFADILICAGSWENIKIVISKIFLEFGKLDIWFLAPYGRGNILLILFGICAMLVVSVVQEKHGDIFMYLSGKCFIIRWLVWYGLIFTILLFGTYGVGYEASPFMYQVF